MVDYVSTFMVFCLPLEEEQLFIETLSIKERMTHCYLLYIYGAMIHIL